MGNRILEPGKMALNFTRGVSITLLIVVLFGVYTVRNLHQSQTIVDHLYYRILIKITY